LTAFSFEPIGRIHSCFTEKFGVPRQPGLVPEAEAHLELFPPYNQSEAFRALERFSHIWVIFVFHDRRCNDWKATVRPPRLGGNQRIGVFASRSGFRPNAIGQSVVRLLTVETSKRGARLRLGGVDLLDGTPVLDIKPYVPYADCIPEAEGGYAPTPPPRSFRVTFSTRSEQMCSTLDPGKYPAVKALIEGLLSRDPRPAYKDNCSANSFGMRLWDLNIRFTMEDRQIIVTSIECLSR